MTSACMAFLGFALWLMYITVFSFGEVVLTHSGTLPILV